MKSAIRISITALGLAGLTALALAGCSNDRSKFENMPKDQQIRSIQYDIAHPTPQQAAMVAKMRGVIAAQQNGAGKTRPPSMPSGAAIH